MFQLQPVGSRAINLSRTSIPSHQPICKHRCILNHHRSPFHLIKDRSIQRIRPEGKLRRNNQGVQQECRGPQPSAGVRGVPEKLLFPPLPPAAAKENTHAERPGDLIIQAFLCFLLHNSRGTFNRVLFHRRGIEKELCPQ